MPLSFSDCFSSMDGRREWVSTSDAAEIIGVSQSRINQMIREGRFPHVIAGPCGFYLLHVEEVDAIAKQRANGEFKRGRRKFRKPKQQ